MIDGIHLPNRPKPTYFDQKDMSSDQNP
jgi:hypothetical protein